MKLIGYLEYFYYATRGGLNLHIAGRLLSRGGFSTSRASRILRKAGATIGSRCTFRTPVILEDGLELSVGNDVWVNYGLTVVGCGNLTIEDNVQVGPRVTVATVSHPLDPVERRSHRMSMHGSIVIQENAWIGANVTICPGVTIGRNSVVGAGSVVTRDVPPNTLAVGVPCKPIKSL